MRLNYNVTSYKTYSKYKKAMSANAVAMQRISSGLKIKSAKDNPGKIATTEATRFQIQSMNMASRNVQDTSSMLQAADGAMQEYNNILSRMKELAVSAADGSKTDSDKRIIQAEIDELKNGLNDLANNTEFNGIKLLGDEKVWDNESPAKLKLQVGALVGETIDISSYNLNTDLMFDKDGNCLQQINVVDGESAGKAIDTISDIINQVSDIRARYGAVQNRLDTTADMLDDNIVNTETANSTLTDADVAAEMMEIARTDVIMNAGIAVIAQSNKFPLNALDVLQSLR